MRTRTPILAGLGFLGAATLVVGLVGDGLFASEQALALGLEQLKACRDLAFSTEEDFYTRGPVPPDGNPIISDGDLLGPNCVICARNQDLLNRYDVALDLGLDAVDVVDVDNYLVAFSTELDSPNVGQFTAGDLLVTNGAIIPNVALLGQFGQPAVDLGLDGIHLVGAPESIIAFLNEASFYPRDYWLAPLTRLSDWLKRYGVDIWFSTEGTAPPTEKPKFVDGDLLSARDGIIVAANSLLLPASVPAGIPERGVDFGLDAVTCKRTGELDLVQFSTEISYDEMPKFTDGDVLRFGGNVVMTNYQLIACFEPYAKFLGLDALFMLVPCIPGDANGDGKIDSGDLAKVLRVILELDTPTCGADANEDSKIDSGDLVKVLRIILGVE